MVPKERLGAPPTGSAPVAMEVLGGDESQVSEPREVVRAGSL
jgi:hypothetical protein